MPCVCGRWALFWCFCSTWCFAQHQIKSIQFSLISFILPTKKKTQKKDNLEANWLEKESNQFSLIFFIKTIKSCVCAAAKSSLNFINVIGVIWNYRCSNGHLKLNPNHHYVCCTERMSTRMCKTRSVSVWMIENKKTDTRCNIYNVYT